MANESAFLDFLDWIDRPGQVVRNLIQGKPGAAGRQIVDIFGDVLDAPLPGDLIPDASGEDDYVSGSDLVGLHDDGVAGYGTDVAIGTATDPWTYIGFGPLVQSLKLGGRLAKSGSQLLPESAQTALRKGGEAIRDTLGWRQLTPEQRAMLDAAQAAEANTKRAGLAEVERILAGSTPEQREAAFNVIQNRRVGPEGASVLAPETAPPVPFQTVDEQIARMDQRIAALGLPDDEASGVRGLVSEAVPFGQRQFREAVDIGGFSRPDGIDLATQAPADYAQRRFSGLLNEGDDEIFGSPSTLKERTLKTAEDLVVFENANPGIRLEDDLGVALSKRAEQQGALARRASIGRALLGDEFDSLANKDTRAKIGEAIEALADKAPDYYRAVKDVYNGLEARGPVMDVLAKFNRLWKPIVVYGAVFPKLGSIVRNATSGAWQAWSALGGQAGAKQLSRVPQQLLGAIDDGIVKAMGMGSRLTGSAITRDIDLIDDAFKRSGGVSANVGAILRSAGRDDLASAVDSGVLQGFVSSEELLRDLSRSKTAKRALDIFDAPGAVFQGVETRMRLATFLDRLKAGRSTTEAAQDTLDAYLDYSLAAKGGAKYRALRDIIPFAAFLTQSIPQQAKFLAGNAPVTVGLSQALQQDDDSMLYPYLEGRANIPLGRDEDGNDVVLSGAGLPFEALNVIPDFSGSLRSLGRSVEQNVVGSIQPLLKTGYSVVSGREPYFGTPFGEYDKIPLVGEAGPVGQAYNILNATGVLAPLDIPLRQLGKATDDKRSAGVRALDLLTGANVVTIDPDRAEIQQLTRQLERDPNVRKATNFYQAGDDDALSETLRALQQAKDRAQQKRREQASVL